MRAEIEKVVRAFADQVVELVQREVDVVVEQAKEQLVTALSGGPVRPVATRSRPRKKVRGVRGATPGSSRREAYVPASTSDGASPSPRTEQPPVEKKPRKCGACGETGHRADRCPNVTQSVPVVDRDIKPENVQQPAADRNDRFARIEAAARARAGAS